MSRLGNTLARLEWAVIGLLLALLTVVVTIQVVSRNTGFYIEWVEDVALLLLVWKVFLASPLAIRHGSHYVVILFGTPPRPLDVALTVLAVFVTVVVLLVLLWKGGELAWQLRFRLSGAGEISMLAYYAAMPVSAVLSLFHLAETLVGGTVPLQSGKQDA